MSTHAIIAVRTTEGYKGRFVHYDGYTEAMIPALERCIQQCKMGKTDPIAYMLGNHWSAFSKFKHEPSESDSHNQTWYTETDTIDAHYLYIIELSKFPNVGYIVTPYIKVFQNWMALDPDNIINNFRSKSKEYV